MRAKNCVKTLHLLLRGGYNEALLKSTTKEWKFSGLPSESELIRVIALPQFCFFLLSRGTGKRGEVSISDGKKAEWMTWGQIEIQHTWTRNKIGFRPKQTFENSKKTKIQKRNFRLFYSFHPFFGPPPDLGKISLIPKVSPVIPPPQFYVSANRETGRPSDFGLVFQTNWQLQFWLLSQFHS